MYIRGLMSDNFFLNSIILNEKPYIPSKQASVSIDLKVADNVQGHLRILFAGSQLNDI